MSCHVYVYVYVYGMFCAPVTSSSKTTPRSRLACELLQSKSSYVPPDHCHERKVCGVEEPN
jgi:hypothetical protein